MRQIAFVGMMLGATTVWAENNAVAVLDIQGTGVEQTLLPTLTEVLTVEIDNLGMYKVIAGRDVQAMLGFEKEKDMVGCTDAACLAEIGGALGVDRIVATHIGKVGNTFVVNIKLINIRMADTEARVYETVRGETDALIATITKSVEKLLGRSSAAAKALAAKRAPPPPPAAVAAAPAPVPRPAAQPAPAPEPEEMAVAEEPAPEEQPAPMSAPTSVSTTGKRHVGWLPITLWSGGGVLAAGGVGTWFIAKRNERLANKKESTDPVVYAVGAQRAAQKAKTFAIVGDVLVAVGGLAVGGGFLAWLLSGSSNSHASAVLVPMATDHGFALTASGTF